MGIPHIPDHLGGGSARPAPLPTRDREDQHQFPDQIHLLAHQFGAKGDVKIYDWLPKTKLEEAIAHLRTLQKVTNSRLFLVTYQMVEIHE